MLDIMNAVASPSDAFSQWPSSRLRVDAFHSRAITNMTHNLYLVGDAQRLGANVTSCGYPTKN